MKTFEAGEKTHNDENFPVASYIISKRHRAPILAFYRFARAADDVADHPQLSAQEKIARLNAFEATLLGTSQTIPEAMALRQVLAERQLSPIHAQELLIAFRQDAQKLRYDDWTDLMNYCRYSAAPVGRFVLDVHGEDQATWPASDALCAALQIINHLQDCQADFKRLNRVYIPQDSFSRHGADIAELAAAQACTGLRLALKELAMQTQNLLTTPLAPQVSNTRLRLEVETIDRLAHKLLALLQTRDPLSEPVHLNKLQLLFTVAQAGIAVFTTPTNTKTHANGERRSSFYLAMRIMPPHQREAMYEIYRFCRAVDDIADDDTEHASERLSQLQQWRNDIAALYQGHAPAAQRALAKAVHAFGLRQEDFLAVIDGMEMDVRGPVHAPDMATLELYCDRVACAVGRLCVRVFGLGESDGRQLAYHLGMALQLTNILRDIDEDAALGRLYLPRESLAAAGINDNDLETILAHPALPKACEQLVEKALAHFAQADNIMAHCKRSAVRPARIMSHAYRAILTALMKHGFTAPRPRVRLAKARLLGLLLRHSLF